ncbi:MAG: choice-of-anchor L domain-containing protein [Myxococcales bacterium]|nr:choice-of-anchor L domain-containing protein [Myxococcales bacterium]
MALQESEEGAQDAHLGLQIQRAEAPRPDPARHRGETLSAPHNGHKVPRIVPTRLAGRVHIPEPMRALERPLPIVGRILAAAALCACSGPAPGQDGPVGPGTAAGALFVDGGAIGPGACTPSPGNFEIPGNQCDDDADGKVDNAPACDASLPVEGTAAHFAQALGVCQMADAQRWGLIAAEYTGSYGSSLPPNPQQHGILSKFGSTLKPRQGGALGVLSSGFAREFNGSATGAFQEGATMAGPGKAPPGYPKPAAGCQIDTAVNDVVSLKLRIKAPANARGVAFDFNFMSGEWPQWVCSRYNDAFVAMLTSSASGSVATNISFDAQKNPVSVNNGFFDRCTPGTMTGCNGDPPVIRTSACAGGETELLGTGFAQRQLYCGNKPSTGGGATGWLTSQAAVKPNEELTLEFLIWDTGDDNYDSLVLLDNLRWEFGETVTVTQRPK